MSKRPPKRIRVNGHQYVLATNTNTDDDVPPDIDYNELLRIAASDKPTAEELQKFSNGLLRVRTNLETATMDLSSVKGTVAAAFQDWSSLGGELVSDKSGSRVGRWLFKQFDKFVRWRLNKLAKKIESAEASARKWSRAFGKARQTILSKFSYR